MNSLKGRTAVVTGAATGIGKAAAEAHCEEGAHTVIADIDAAGGEGAANELKGKGYSASSIHVDISKISDIQRCVRELVERLSKIDILMNNAGLYSTVPIPLGRVARPEELGRAIAFLASDDASCITGEIMDVNGGIYMD